MSSEQNNLSNNQAENNLVNVNNNLDVVGPILSNNQADNDLPNNSVDDSISINSVEPILNENIQNNSSNNQQENDRINNDDSVIINNVEPVLNIQDNTNQDQEEPEQEQNFEDANEINNEFEQYFVNEDMDEDDDDYEYDYEDEYDDEEDDDEIDEEDQEDGEIYEDTIQDNNDDYENVEAPSTITYDTELPSTHNYLGQNFQEIISSKHVLDSNDEIQIPILPLPGNNYYENDTDNNVQLIPGQVMPIYFYSPTQIQVIRKRMNEQDPTIGFALCPNSLRVSNENTSQQASQNNDENKDDVKLGILAEIISASYQNENSEITDFSSLIESAGGLILKVKGRERFRIMKIRKDITGTMIATVRILPEYVLDVNPLVRQCPRNLSYAYDSYLHKSKDSTFQCSQSKAEFLNTQLNLPSWIYRNYDCDYIIHLIRKELTETFKQQINFEDVDSKETNNAKVFCSWLLTNFPFDNKMRINCLKMNCINQRLFYMYKLLKNFTNISCRLCNNQFCTKSDVFSISKQGFMSAFLNPGGVVHETLTVYKLKNFHIMNARPSTQHSWFPGYGWQIITCRRCNNHIGWKFTSAKPNLIPEKFFGLTRKAIQYTYNEKNESETNNQQQVGQNQTGEINAE